MTPRRMTAEQYYALTVEGDRKQLVGGEIVVNEPKLIHAALQGRLYHPCEPGSTRATDAALSRFRPT